MGGYWEGELPVAIATAGTLVQSPRQCLVARERFGRQGKGARQAAALFPRWLSRIQDRWQELLLCLSRTTITIQRNFYSVTSCLLSLCVCVFVSVSHGVVELLACLAQWRSDFWTKRASLSDKPCSRMTVALTHTHTCTHSTSTSVHKAGAGAGEHYTVSSSTRLCL